MEPNLICIKIFHILSAGTV